MVHLGLGKFLLHISHKNSENISLLKSKSKIKMHNYKDSIMFIENNNNFVYFVLRNLNTIAYATIFFREGKPPVNHVASYKIKSHMIEKTSDFFENQK